MGRKKIIVKNKIKKSLKLGKTIGKGIIFALAIACGLGSPYLLIPSKWPKRRYYTRDSLINGELLPDEDQEKVRKSVYYLKRKKLVEWKVEGGEAILKLTREGKKYFSKCLFEDINLSKEGRKWDGYWRFFLFDIPEKNRIVRDALREKLCHLGFFQLQKSVWVFPYECEMEMNFTIDYLNATSYVLMFTARIKNDGLLKKYFIKKGFRL